MKPYLAIILTLAWSIACVQAQFLNFTHVGGGATGSLTKNSDTSYTLVGGGNDIWDVTDEFDYAYVQAVGDFDVHVRVESLEPVARWTKAGIMVRENLSSESRNGFIRTTPAAVPTGSGGDGANDTRFAYRTAIPDSAGRTGGQHEDGAAVPAYPNAWIRLQRVGSILRAYASTDGTTWEQQGGDQDTTTWTGGAMPSQVLLGLAVSRHSGPDPLATCEFRDLAATVLTLAPFGIISVNTTPGLATALNVVFSEPVNEGDAETVANYAISGVTVSGAELQADGRTVRLATSALNAPGCRILTVNNIRNGGGTAIAPNTMAPVIYADGGAFQQRYEGPSNIGMLTSDPDFPNNPNATSYMSSLDTGDGDHGENFGLRVRAMLTAPMTGNYVFATASDDQSQVWLSTDENPANKVMIANEPNWAGYRTYIHDGTGQGGRPGCGGVAGSEACENISSPVTLQAGCKYFLEILFAEGCCGDHFAITWQLPGNPVIANGQTPIGAAYISPIPAVPVTLGTSQPADQTLSANTPLDVSVNITAGSPAIHIQWYKDGAPIPGATTATYRVNELAQPSDSGNYHAVVQNGGGVASSRTARIEVVVDTVAPSLVRAGAPAGNDTQFDLLFSEPVNEADAENLGNYSMAGVTLNSAVLQADNRTVRFTCSSLYIPGCEVLAVSNVRDRAIPPNTLASGIVGVLAASGTMTYYQYNVGGDQQIGLLTSHANYPNAPDVTTTVTQFENPNGGGGQGDNYGALIRGYVHPGVSGNYIFHIAADDNAALYLSTDENPANKVIIANEPEWGGFREYTGTAGGRRDGCNCGACDNISKPIPLQAGCKYYAELIYKEGGGGDYGSVAWRLAGDPAPANGSAPIGAANISPYTPPGPPAEDGQPPQIVLVAGSTTLDRLTVTFNEPVEPTAAGDEFSYTVSSAAAVLNVTAADMLDATTAVITLDPGTPLQLDTDYTVTADGITDLAMNTAGQLTGSFHSVVEGCGGVIFEAYPTGGNVWTCQLNTHPSFPNNPDFRMTIPGLDSRLAYPTDNRENYGARLRGLFVAPYTADWVFYLRADDGAELYFNPNGIDPAGAQLASWEWSCCKTFEQIPTAPYRLVGGRPYYIEARYKEGGGGDYGQVAARPKGVAGPLAPVGATSVGQYAVPGFSGSLAVSGPGDASVMENRVVSFSVDAVSSLGLPICYQWNRDGSPIAGATGPSYSFRATCADNAAVFTCRVSIIGNVVNSAAATLTVTVDGAPPRVVSASGTDTLRNVIVNFDELVDPTSAGDEFNYAIPGLTVEAADLMGNGTSVKLTTTEQTQAAVYTVTVTGVSDLATCNGPNVIAGNNTATFTALRFSPGFLKFEYWGGINGNISVLTGDPRYPDKPDATYYMSAFDTRTVFPDNSHERYGGRVSGAVVPPVSGNFLFYLASDDPGQLFLNVNGYNPNANALIAEEPGCCGGWVKAGVSPSAPQALTAGSLYSIAGLYTEGGGGDYLKVAAGLEGTPAPPDNPNQQMPVSAYAIPAPYIGVMTDPTTGASGRITRQPTDTTACINPLTPTQVPAEFSVGIETAPAGVPHHIRWERLSGGQWVAAGSGASISFFPELDAHGTKYRAVLYVLGLGAPIVSDEVTLSVYQANTPPGFDLGASAPCAVGGSPQSIAGFASNITPHSIPRTPVAFASAFDSTPSWLTRYGGDGNCAPTWQAVVEAGVLKLINAGIGSSFGAAGISLPLQTYESLEVSWKSLIGGGGDGADGYSLSIGDALAGNPCYGGEEGKGDDLIISVDTFNNAELRPGGVDDGIQIMWGGNNAFMNELAFQHIPKNDDGSGVYLRKNTFVDAKVTVDAAGLVTFTYDGQTISGQIPGYTGIRADRALFWARTGGANDNHWIDDLDLKAFPFDRSSVESAQNVTFEVSNNHPERFSQQPAISPNGTLTYALVPNVCGKRTVVSVVARDNGGPECNGDNTSDPKTFEIVCGNCCPEATPQSTAARSGSPTPITLSGTDPDNDPLSCAIVRLPAHGTVVLNGCVATYTSNAGYTGPDSFDFTVSDGECTSTPAATVSIDVRICQLACRVGVGPAACGVTFPNSGKTYTISLDGSAVCLTLDGSATTASADCGPLSYSWVVDVTNTLSGPLVTTCLAPGCHQITLIVTEGTASCQQTIDLCVISPSEAVEQIIALVESTSVERKNKRPLIVSLKAAKDRFERDSLAVGGQMLQVFQHKVRAQIARNNPAEAADFTAAAQDVIDAIECVENLPPRNDE